MLNNLRNFNVILGSTSTRRKALLKKLHLQFNVLNPNFEENYIENIPIRKVPLYLAMKKAECLKDKVTKNDILLTADTVLIFKKKLVGKPKSSTEAKYILKNLSAKKHEVITAVQILYNNITKHIEDTTFVYFKALTDEEISFYVDNYKPFDKAGAYGIQEWIALIGIKKIYGSFYNVMGLPVHKVYEVFKGI